MGGSQACPSGRESQGLCARHRSTGAGAVARERCSAPRGCTRVVAPRPRLLGDLRWRSMMWPRARGMVERAPVQSAWGWATGLTPASRHLITLPWPVRDGRWRYAGSASRAWPSMPLRQGRCGPTARPMPRHDLRSPSTHAIRARVSAAQQWHAQSRTTGPRRGRAAASHSA